MVVGLLLLMVMLLLLLVLVLVLLLLLLLFLSNAPTAATVHDGHLLFDFPTRSHSHHRVSLSNSVWIQPSADDVDLIRLDGLLPLR